jgi:3-oxoacyl-[acyl-carrier protein] reductase
MSPFEANGGGAIVTGASRGIGLAIARRLVADGFGVVGCARTPETAARALAGLGEGAIGLTADVSDPADVERLLVAARESFGEVTVLVNNAGIYGRAGVLEISLEQWRQTLEVNLTGAFLLAQAVAREMVGRGTRGRIVNIASTTGILAEAESSHYNASKAGMISLTQSLALELGPHGICTNCVAPGWVDTGIDPAADDLDAEALSRLNPVGRFGAPEEIAHAVAMMCDLRAGFMNGTIAAVDGGQVAGSPSP